MAKEKRIGLFETDVTLTGKHATYLKYLVNDAKIYDDYIDVYMNAAVLGFLYSKKEDRDNGSADRARIYADAFSTHRDECIFLYRLIMLLDEDDITVDERLDKAFRYDSNPEKIEDFKENLEIFDSYVRGGIEYMYDVFVTGCTSRDDYIRETFNVIRNFKDSIEGVSYDEKIKKLLNR
ncbi:hypothetical protein [Oribacterium sp. Sow4_G1_1]|uniref:hypothetical protein n=1 Tax=Oribacterium sp. Sow4_G1_1 TaxID=3438794 RepID=UPI003F9935FE